MYDRGLKKIEELSLRALEGAMAEIGVHGNDEFDLQPIIYRATMNFMTQFLVGKMYR